MFACLHFVGRASFITCPSLALGSQEINSLYFIWTRQDLSLTQSLLPICLLINDFTFSLIASIRCSHNLYSHLFTIDVWFDFG